MKHEGYVPAFALTLCCAGPFGQTVASSLEGAVGDQANAVVLGATVTLPSAETTNFDVTLTKNVPLGERRLLKFQVQAYNVFNHTEINSINSSIQFNPATNVVSNLSSLGYATGTLSNRVMTFTARFQF
jgi:hypothetical protein